MKGKARINKGLEAARITEQVKLVVTDMGYLKLEEVRLLQGLGIKTAISYLEWTQEGLTE